MQPTTLLLVDDNPANLVALEAVLKEAGYRTLSASSGQEALDIIKHDEPDLVLLDIQMPEMDGFETARRMKEMPHGRNVPIIFITAVFKEDPFIKKGYEAGGVDYFTKPFDPDILKMKIAIYASFRQRDILLKEREKRLKESEELLKAGRKLAAILENLPVGVIIADVGGRIIQTNDEVLKILKSIEPFERDSYGEFLSWWSREGPVIKDALTLALSTGRATHNEITSIRCFDGSVKTVLNSVSPLRGLDDEIVGAVAVVQDVTEHKKIEGDIEERILKLISIGVGFEQQKS